MNEKNILQLRTNVTSNVANIQENLLYRKRTNYTCKNDRTTRNR